MDIKKPGSSNNSFTNKVNDDRVYRNVFVDDNIFKLFRMKSIELDISLYGLVEKALNGILENNDIIENKKNAGVKKSIAVNKITLKKVKEYAIINNINIQDIFLSAILSVIKHKT